MNTTIHLGIAFDANYMRHFYALFASILHHNRNNKIVVHAIITGLTQIEQDQIRNYAESNEAFILFYEIDEEYVRQFIVDKHWSSAVYYRLFFPLLINKGVERLLYLDTDIIVLNDLAELYAIDMENYPIAAVYDNWVKSAPQLGINEEGNYFNSGMMLINMSVWNQQEISQKCFNYLSLYPERILYVDQDALNAVLVNNWKKLPFRFNTLHSWIPEGMTKKEIQVFLRDKVIIHYTLDRPWKMLCKNPLRYLYYQYLKSSHFKLKYKYDDYSIRKIPAYLRIRLNEIYHNQPYIKTLWRTLKTSVLGKSAAAKLF